MAKTKIEKVAKVGIKKEDGWLYFIDREGDISRERLNRNGRKPKKKRK